MVTNSWFSTSRAYCHPQVVSIFLLGFSSGLPFLLTLATLHVWLTEVGVNKTTLGLFVLATFPYTLKFLWAPIMDRVSIPGICPFLGHRKGWILCSQLFLMGALVGLGFSNPAQTIWKTAFWTFLVAFFSAAQDLGIEAYRVESLDSHQIGPGAGASVLGYRCGMWVSGAGALYLAACFQWPVAYALMAVFLGVGVIAILLSSEPQRSYHPYKLSFEEAIPEGRQKILLFPLQLSQHSSSALSFRLWIQNFFWMPLRSLFKRSDWKVIFLFILSYKVGDTVLNTLTMPFLLEIGFTKIQIAHVAKSFGIGAMIFGGAMGGLLLSRRPLLQTLMLCSFLQIIASMMFMIQALVGKKMIILFATIGIENLACGMGSAAFIAYLSTRCRLPHTATHFALLSSFGSLVRVTFSSLAGWLADQWVWSLFYAFTAVACVPCLLILIIFPHHFVYPFMRKRSEVKVA